MHLGKSQTRQLIWQSCELLKTEFYNGKYPATLIIDGATSLAF